MQDRTDHRGYQQPREVISAEELRDDMGSAASSGGIQDDRVTYTRVAPEPAMATGSAAGTAGGLLRGLRRDYDADRTRDVAIPEAYNLDRDRVRWGPVVAGLVSALTSLLLLSLLGLAVGLTAANAGEAVARGTAPENMGRNTAIWGAISAVLAFLVGGYVAGRTAAIFDRKWGALNGALVFLLAVPLLLWLAGQGLGAIAGTLGTFVQGLNVDPAQAQNVTSEQAAQAAERARNTAWGTLLGSLLGLGASALGGYLGTRRAVEVDRRTGQIAD